MKFSSKFSAKIRLLLLLSVLFLVGITFKSFSKAQAQTPADFTLVVLPDTQFYSESYPEIFNAQTQWIVANKTAGNIAYVAHEGDIVQTASDATQWENASTAMGFLEDPATTGLPDGVPYGVVPGNHDEAGLYNSYFGVARFAGRSYYGGEYPTGDNQNNYTLFTAGSMDFIVINLDYLSPAAGSLDWADALLKTYSTRRAMVVSHSILNADATFSSRGQEIYESLKDNPNLFLTLSGHVGGSETQRTDVYNGRTVYSLLADYQTRIQGGTGWLRILEFSPANNEIRVKTYSPYLNQWETDANSEFILPYDFSTVLPTPTPTPSGGPTPTPTPVTTTLTFPAVADAMIKQDSPNTNYGTNATLTVDGSPVQQMLFKFNVSGTSGKQISSAKLRLYSTAGSTVTGGWFYRTADTSWIESGSGGVTWNTAPAVDAAPLTTLGAIGMNVWQEINVLSAVAGDGLISFRVTSNNSDGANYASREAAANKPELVVVVTDGTTPTPTPTPTVGPTPTPLPSPTPTPTPIPTPPPTPTPTPTVGPTPTPTPTPVPSPTPTPTPWPTPTPTPGGQTTLTIPVAADALIKQDYPNTNYGTNATLTVDSSPVLQSLLKFNVTGVAGRQVVSAKLRLYYTAGSNATGGWFHRTADTSWIESSSGGINGVTWSTAPAPDATPLVKLGAVAASQWYEIEVTPAITGDGLVSFRVTSDNSDGANFNAKEATTNRPQLVVTVQ